MRTPEPDDVTDGASTGQDHESTAEAGPKPSDTGAGDSSSAGAYTSDTLGGTLDLLEQIGSREQPSQWVPTGFEDLDDLFGGGLWPGHLVVIGGRPGMGTSTLALDIARSAAIGNDIQTLFLCPDTSTNEINFRLMAATAKVPVNYLRNGLMRDQDWDATVASMQKLSAAPLRVDTRPRLTLDAVSAAVDAAVAAGTRLVVLDGLQSLVPVSPRDTRYHEVCEQVHGIKRLARVHNIPVIVTSTLSRASEARADKVPMLYDLRNAGDIEDVADAVIFVHRDDMYEAESTRPGEADLIVAKHRHGPTRTIVVAFQGHYSRFVDIAPRTSTPTAR